MGAGIASPRGTVNFKTMLEQGIGPYHDQARCRLGWHDESSVFLPPWGSCELSRNRRHGAEFGLVVARWQVFCCNMENKPCLMSEVPGQQAARLGPQRSHWSRVADLTHFFPRSCLLIGRMGRQNREPGIQNRASTKPLSNMTEYGAWLTASLHGYYVCTRHLQNRHGRQDPTSSLTTLSRVTRTPRWISNAWPLLIVQCHLVVYLVKYLRYTGSISILAINIVYNITKDVHDEGYSGIINTPGEKRPAIAKHHPGICELRASKKLSPYCWSWSDPNWFGTFAVPNIQLFQSGHAPPSAYDIGTGCPF